MLGSGDGGGDLTAPCAEATVTTVTLCVQVSCTGRRGRPLPHWRETPQSLCHFSPSGCTGVGVCVHTAAHSHRRLVW